MHHDACDDLVIFPFFGGQMLSSLAAATDHNPTRTMQMMVEMVARG